MQRMHLLPFIALSIAIAGCTSQPAADATPASPAAAAAPDPAALRATIEATEKQWSAAYMKGDAAAIAALYSEDAATIPASGEWRRGRDAIAKQTQSELDTVTVTTREDVTEEVTVAGDYAVEVGHYAWTGTSKKTGAARGEKGRYIVVWHKDADGTWRLYRDIGVTATDGQ